jgi:hypothetical protein
VLTVQQDNQRVFLKEQLILILSRLKRLVGTSVKVLCARCIQRTKPLSSSLPVLANRCLVPVILRRNGENTTLMGCTGSEMADLGTASAAIALQNKSCMLH